MNANFKLMQRKKRRKNIRAKVKGTALRPRLAVFKSNTHFWVQFINDEKGQTLATASDIKLAKSTITKKTKTQIAFLVGELAAKNAKAKKISKVIFDRGGYKYHGPVKAFAGCARKAGLEF